MSQPRWSFITVTFNSASALGAHWRNPLPADAEWIVVDNASRDESAAVAASLGARVIKLDVNVGFGAANNIGYQSARGEFIAFVNPDVIVDFDTLPAIEASLCKWGGLVGPQLTYPGGELQPSGRGVPSLTNKVFSRLGWHRIVARYHLFAAADQDLYAAWVIGAAVIAQRNTFDALRAGGPWDPHFFVYYEDSDLGIRAWLAGQTVRVVGNARWVHTWARETKQIRLKPWLLEWQSMRRFYRRYPRMLIGSGGPTLAASKAQWGQSQKAVGS